MVRNGQERSGKARKGKERPEKIRKGNQREPNVNSFCSLKLFKLVP